MSSFHDVVIMGEEAIAADELPRERFRIVENNIVNTVCYADIMAAIIAISRGMNWITDYDRYPSRKFEYPFAYLSGSVTKSMRVLDAGCSIDPFAPFLASKGARVAGVDNFATHDVPWDPEHGIFRGRYTGFEKAQRYSEHLRATYGLSVSYYKSDMVRMPFPDRSFERIFCISVLEHLPKWKVRFAFDEWRRILASDGVAVITLDYVSNGRRNLNIGELLRETSFSLQGEVVIYPTMNVIEDTSLVVAGFVCCPEGGDYHAPMISKAYRGNPITRATVDGTYALINKVWQIVNSR